MIITNPKPNITRVCVKNHVYNSTEYIELPLSREEIIKSLLRMRRWLKHNEKPLMLGVCIGPQITFHWHSEDNNFAKAIMEAALLPYRTFELLKNRGQEYDCTK